MKLIYKLHQIHLFIEVFFPFDVVIAVLFLFRMQFEVQKVN